MSRALKTLKPNSKYDEKYFDEVVNFLWKKRKKIFTNNTDLDEEYTYKFDYPDYYGLPERICNKISSDFVDAIQNAIECLNENTTKREFARYCAHYLYSN